MTSPMHALLFLQKIKSYKYKSQNKYKSYSKNESHRKYKSHVTYTNLSS